MAMPEWMQTAFLFQSIFGFRYAETLELLMSMPEWLQFQSVFGFRYAETLF